VLFGVALGGRAAVPSSTPQFRVDASMHTAAIGQMRADAPRNRVVTVGSDRTVRIWQLPSLRLVRVLRLPQEGAVEGLPVGLAISPDGSRIAVGGATGRSWEGTVSIYVYDTVSGRLVQRVPGFADLIAALDWSADGRRLAVGLAGQRGVQLIDTTSWKTIAQDGEYADSVTFVHFSARGMLAAAAADGAVRLYDANFRLVGRQPVGVSRLLGGVRFSPDGQLLALGVLDKPLALVLKVPSLELATLRQVPDAQQKGLCCIAWSRDGESLFVNGAHEGRGPTPLYRFGGRGQGPLAATLPVGDHTVTNMLPLANGELLFATGMPSLTLLDAQGKQRGSVSTVIGDFRDGQRQLKVSADGQLLSLPMARGGEAPRAFSVTDLDLPPLDATMLAPRVVDAGFKLDGLAADGAGAPLGTPVRINGTPLDMLAGDRVTAHAFAHDGNALFLGTLWRAMRLDRTGTPAWRQDFSTEVQGLNATANGAYLVVMLADGTVRWLRQSDGREVLAFFAHRTDDEWVLWRPDGYYASSERGDEYVGWHVNRGLDQSPDFYRAVQFERVFYRPDLLRNVLADAAVATRGSVAALDLEPIAPARIAVEATEARLNGRGRVEITLRLSAQARALPMQQLAVYVNGLPVTPTRERQLTGADRSRFARSLTVESDARENDIRIEVDQGRSLGLAETYAELEAARPLPPSAPVRGRLFLLAIGINRFVNVPAERKDRLQDLEFAAQDAQAFSEAMQRASHGLYREVKTVLLNDTSASRPDKQEIRKALATLQDAGPDDTVMVFLASHGFSDRAGNYFFMARDGRYDDVKTVVESDSATGSAPSLIEGEEFFGALRQVAGRRILVVDTCHARRIEGLVDTHSLRKRSAASSLAFMVAAKGNQESQEYAPAGHGLFTHALLESLKAGADANGDGMVSLREAFESLAPMVQRLRARGLRQTPQLIAPEALINQTLVALR
jgi:hypothetical protein